MTVSQLRKDLEEMEAKGHGECKVVAYSADHEEGSFASRVRVVTGRDNCPYFKGDSPYRQGYSGNFVFVM